MVTLLVLTLHTRDSNQSLMVILYAWALVFGVAVPVVVVLDLVPDLVPVRTRIARVLPCLGTGTVEMWE